MKRLDGRVLRSLVIALAVAGVALAAVVASATRAGGHALAAPPGSVKVFSRGKFICHAAAAPSGWYFAAHCLRFGAPTLADLMVRPFAPDPQGRDIAHMVDGRFTTATLGTAGIGDMLAWRNERTAGTARFVRVTSGHTAPGVWLIDQPGQTVWILCRSSGGPLLRGDSGTGMGNPRGELSALFVGGDLDGQIGSAECGPAQRVFGVPVP